MPPSVGTLCFVQAQMEQCFKQGTVSVIHLPESHPHHPNKLYSDGHNPDQGSPTTRARFFQSVGNPGHLSPVAARVAQALGVPLPEEISMPASNATRQRQRGQVEEGSGKAEQLTARERKLQEPWWTDLWAASKKASVRHHQMCLTHGPCCIPTLCLNLWLHS